MVAGFLVHRANADVEVVSVESSLNTVHTATDSQVRHCIPVVCLVLLVCLSRMVWTSREERESLGSVPNAVSPASKAGPRMPMRDMPEHEKETERARRGHSSTLHADIVTSCEMGDVHVGGSKRVSCDAMISDEIQVRKVQRLRNEAAVHVVLGELEPRLRSWMARPSAGRRERL